MKVILIIFLLIIERSYTENEETSTGRLSVEESNALKDTCGKHFLSKKIEKRSVGGRKAEKDEFPWTVAVSGPIVCSGALISDHHVLTSAHCAIKRIYGVPCEEATLVSSYEKLPFEDIVLISGMGEGCSVDTKDGCKVFNVKDMFIHPKHNPCTGDYDIALLELSSSMNSQQGLPICMPKEDEDIPTSRNRMTSSGFGYNPEHPGERYLEALNLTMEGTERTRARIITKSRGKSICTGDSGGPLFKVKKNKSNRSSRNYNGFS